MPPSPKFFGDFVVRDVLADHGGPMVPQDDRAVGNKSSRQRSGQAIASCLIYLDLGLFGDPLVEILAVGCSMGNCFSTHNGYSTLVQLNNRTGRR
jgi:hypothetical protein